MSIRVAINGYGRIGRNILRAKYESGDERIQIVAINDLGDAHTNAHLTRYDTVHGRFPGQVEASDDHIVINNDKIVVFSQRNPAELPWAELKVDVVHESTGLFASRAKASTHLQAGAKKVIISSPGDGDVDATIVYGVNHNTLKPTDTVISNASCTTNCLAPMAKVLNDSVGIVHGLMNTVHSYTNDQSLSDAYHSDLRRARAAARSMIPTQTGAATAIGLVLPELAGKLDGFAIRVPTVNVSLVDFTFVAARKTSDTQINQIFKEAADGKILGYSEEPLVSSDYNHVSLSSTLDASMTRVTGGTLVKVCGWYDNEWGFSHRMLDTTSAFMDAAD